MKFAATISIGPRRLDVCVRKPRKLIGYSLALARKAYGDMGVAKTSVPPARLSFSSALFNKLQPMISCTAFYFLLLVKTYDFRAIQ